MLKLPGSGCCRDIKPASSKLPNTPTSATTPCFAALPLPAPRLPSLPAAWFGYTYGLGVRPYGRMWAMQYTRAIWLERRANLLQPGWAQSLPPWAPRRMVAVVASCDGLGIRKGGEREGEGKSGQQDRDEDSGRRAVWEERVQLRPRHSSLITGPTECCLCQGGSPTSGVAAAFAATLDAAWMQKCRRGCHQIGVTPA